jgi:hypothetical protein
MKPIRLEGQDGLEVLVNPERVVLVQGDRVPAKIRPVADGVDELVEPSYTGSTILLDLTDRHGQNVTVSVKQPPSSVYNELYHARSWRSGGRS